MTDQYDEKIALYDKLFKIFLGIATLSILIGVIIGVRQVFIVGYKIDNNVKETKRYVECIMLLNKTHPDVNFETATLKQTKAILDECTHSNP